ncbi:F0F1 ATP synthase subunit epsilon [Acidihalobacter prosperus]|uniref:ATP synthase epsilon chain n=1 Tax=Acidihalobacter prosperus TaxID=160660 RepID=A0A1A6C4R1_9GAMM|nr:F0F1 ATP synthase subunit epsilon [Acidihalobacter prosperus]OBS09556.1 ATP synthase epsilon chain [Acidihalobacter prosperus]
MAMTMHVNIVSAEESIYSGTAEHLFAPAALGEVGIWPRHTPLLSQLKPGEVRVKPEGSAETMHFFVSGGVLEVQPHVVTVLADSAVRAKDLDEAEAKAAKERAEASMANRKADIDFARAQAELAEAEARLRMIRNLKQGRHG